MCVCILGYMCRFAAVAQSCGVCRLFALFEKHCRDTLAIVCGTGRVVGLRSGTNRLVPGT